MILYPETLAVMDPRVEAARAVVDKCPRETTDAITREYSSTWVLCMKHRKSDVVWLEDENLTRRQEVYTWKEYKFPPTEYLGERQKMVIRPLHQPPPQYEAQEELKEAYSP